MGQERNITLDYFKLILSFLVITIHSSIGFTGTGGWLLVNAIAHLAVPCFLTINGYYIYEIIYTPKKVKGYFIHVLIIYTIWSIIYVPISIIEIQSIKKAIIQYFTGGYWHLWYIYALLAGTVLLYIFRNIKPYLLIAFTVIIYLFLSIIQNYNYTISGIRIYHLLLYSFIFLITGFCINKSNILHKKINIKYILALITLFTTILLIESYYFKIYTKTILNNYSHFSLLFLAPLLFIIVMKASFYKNVDGYISKLASAIYFSHIIILFMVRSIFKMSDLYCFPITLFFCLLIGHTIVSLNNKIRIFL